MESRDFDLVVIGAGPAGLSAALEAQRGGLKKVLVLEKGPAHSQMIRTYYKESKRVDAQYAGQEALCFGLLCLKDGNRESYLSFMDFVIASNKLAVEYKTEVWAIKKNAEHFEVSTSAQETIKAKTVVIAIGRMGKPQTPDYWKDVPATLKQNKSLIFDINSRSLEGLKVLVVGGGDSACEYAEMLHEKSQVTLSYRKAAITRANELNVRIVDRLLKEEKIRGLMSTDILGILDSGTGQPLVQFSTGASEAFDAVLFALGGRTPADFLKSSGVKLDDRSEPQVTEAKESSVPGLFVVGDLLGKSRGGGSIISGFNSAAAAVRSMLQTYFNVQLEPEFVALDHMRF
jgi:thioredoxin reductase (NADPH)